MVASLEAIINKSIDGDEIDLVLELPVAKTDYSDGLSLNWSTTQYNSEISISPSTLNFDAQDYNFDFKQTF